MNEVKNLFSQLSPPQNTSFSPPQNSNQGIGLPPGFMAPGMNYNPNDHMQGGFPQSQTPGQLPPGMGTGFPYGPYPGMMPGQQLASREEQSTNIPVFTHEHGMMNARAPVENLAQYNQLGGKWINLKRNLYGYNPARPY